MNDEAQPEIETADAGALEPAIASPAPGLEDEGASEASEARDVVEARDARPVGESDEAGEARRAAPKPETRGDGAEPSREADETEDSMAPPASALPADLSREAAIVETVLFLETEPLDEAGIARASGLGRDVVEKALELLRDELSGSMHGIEPVQISGGWTLAPKKELWSSLRERYGRKSEQKLSRAALETLSIVAYSQPITRAEIEAIRGVQADNMIRLLLDRGLVHEVGKKDAPGKPIQYGTTREFLKFFRLNSIAELPKLDDVERERFALEDSEA